MDRTALALARALADGEVRSGPALGAELGVTRAAVSRAVRRLQAAGVAVVVLPGRGYRLAGPWRPLAAGRIAAACEAAGVACPRLEVEPVLDSTSARLLAATTLDDPPRALFAEAQSAGRGRYGREWRSPLGGGLYFSLRWPFGGEGRGRAGWPLAALPLAVAVALAEALRDQGAPVAIKWPNDLVAGDAKLGGVLVELIGDPAGTATAVVGVGINLREPGGVERPTVGLETLLGGPPADPSRLAGRLLAAVCGACEAYAEGGFAVFAGRWAGLDALAGRWLRVAAGGETVEGRAEGVDGDGALRLRTAAGPVRRLSGEVTVAPTATPGR